MLMPGESRPSSPSPVAYRLVEIVERNAEELTRAYIRDVVTHAETPTYRRLEEREVYLRAHRVFSQLGKWISTSFSDENMKKYWTDLGRRRRGEGFALSEIMMSLCFIRRRIWKKIELDGLLDTASDLYQALELQARVSLFFETALYYAVRGYEESA
jgi:hypothetical protein